jgi:hypothetical protein
MADDSGLQVEVPREYLASLADWLSADDGLRGRVRPVRRAPDPGHLGVPVELLSVSLGSGGVGVALIRAVCGWLSQRRSDVSVTIRDADGRLVKIDTTRAPDPEAVVREAATLFAALRDQGEKRDQD